MFANVAIDRKSSLALEIMKISGMDAAQILHMFKLQGEVVLEQGALAGAPAYIQNRFRTAWVNAWTPRAEMLVVDIAQVWGEKFTEPELEEILAFYRTPVGVKCASLMSELAEIGTRVGAQYGAEVEAEIGHILTGS